MTYQNLQVWQKAIDFVEEIYIITKSFPEEEKFGLTSQLRRAAVSIPSNIAEGSCRSSTKEYIKFLYVAKGSVSELYTQLLICERIGYLSAYQLTPLTRSSEEISKMLSAIILKLEEKIK